MKSATGDRNDGKFRLLPAEFSDVAIVNREVVEIQEQHPTAVFTELGSQVCQRMGASNEIAVIFQESAEIQAFPFVTAHYHDWTLHPRSP